MTAHRAFVAALLLAAAPVLAQPAWKDLNTQGFRLYQQGKLEQALELFRQAIAADDFAALPHYNFAATLGVLRKRGKTCHVDAYKATILEHLERSVALDPQRAVRMKRDRDFDDVRDTVRYQRLLGLLPTRPEHVTPLLEAVSWFNAPRGVYGSTIGFDFQPRGKVAIWKLEFTEEEAPKRVLQTGTFTVSGTKFVIRLQEPLEGKTTLEGTLTEQGRLELEPPLGTFTDLPSECEA